MNLLDLQLAYDSLRYFTVARTYNFLFYIFGAEQDEIIFDKNPTTPSSLISKETQGLLASRIEIIFWGGPPDNAFWCRGSFLDMLIDRFLYNVARKNEKTISRFLESLADGTITPRVSD
jgi:hypothetical protein